MIYYKTLKKYLTYNPDTGLFFWLTTGSGRCCAGSAGCNNGKYVSVKIEGSSYYAHRLAWLYVYGGWPKNHIDHINHIGTDNRIANLRIATQKTNMRNSSKSTRSTSGYVGVSWCKRTQKWLAQIMVNGKTKHLGYHEDKFEALCARKSANIKYEFHPNHGDS